MSVKQMAVFATFEHNGAINNRLNSHNRLDSNSLFNLKYIKMQQPSLDVFKQNCSDKAVNNWFNSKLKKMKQSKHKKYERTWNFNKKKKKLKKKIKTGLCPLHIQKNLFFI